MISLSHWHRNTGDKFKENRKRGFVSPPKCNRFFFGPCPTPPKNFIKFLKIFCTHFFNDRQTHRPLRKHNLLDGHTSTCRYKDRSLWNSMELDSRQQTFRRCWSKLAENNLTAVRVCRHRRVSYDRRCHSADRASNVSTVESPRSSSSKMSLRTRSMHSLEWCARYADCSLVNSIHSLRWPVSWWATSRSEVFDKTVRFDIRRIADMIPPVTGQHLACSTAGWGILSWTASEN